ncbi:MAG TPA: hypothetical protein VE779_10815 [Candidatus Angelobacter sp.]|jgi:Mn2+/Fe2+ NRAMP family transporter|nr:hypothetical protein [Candidatus Angelobacter sp.]
MAQGTRHHHHNRKARRIARILRIVAIVIMGSGVATFAYNAYWQSVCSDKNSDLVTSVPFIRPDKASCVSLWNVESYLRLSALAVLVAIAMIIGASVTLSDARRNTKRLALSIEVVVLLLIVAYSLLWMFVFR